MHSREQLEEMQRLPLSRKIQITTARIIEWYQHYDGNVGTTIADGMNLMFNTTRFTPDFIPLACATLATIGKYFKSTQTNNNERR